jgi:hypothetical protein
LRVGGSERIDKAKSWAIRPDFQCSQDHAFVLMLESAQADDGSEKTGGNRNRQMRVCLRREDERNFRQYRIRRRTSISPRLA